MNHLNGQLLRGGHKGRCLRFTGQQAVPQWSPKFLAPRVSLRVNEDEQALTK
jgi:hypothetical protein